MPSCASSCRLGDPLWQGAHRVNLKPANKCNCSFVQILAGEVILFGKVPIVSTKGNHRAQTYVSASAVVRNCQRSLLVVPRPEVGKGRVE